MKKMKNFSEAKCQNLKQSDFIDFRKASPEALITMLKAMNREMGEAIAQKRHPTLEGIYRRLSPSTPCFQ